MQDPERGGRCAQGHDQNSTSRGVNFSLNGQRSTGTDILLDGVENIELFNDAVEDFALHNRTALGYLVSRFFGGSCELLVVNLLKEETVSRAELRRIKKMITESEGVPR